MLDAYLMKLGLTDKERKIYIVLAEVGVQPASVIARRCALDRVTTYKHLKKLAGRELVNVYVRDGVQCFGIESFDAIQSSLHVQLKEYEELLQQYPIASNLLRSLKGGEDVIPRLQLFEGEAGIRSLFRDILFEIKETQIRQIRMLSSNTFEEWLSDASLKKSVREFFEELKQRSIDVDLFEITGGLVPEHLEKLPFSDLSLDRLPITRGTTGIFLVGHTIYMACYKQSPIGIKMKQADLSQIFHFLFDTVGGGNSHTE